MKSQLHRKTADNFLPPLLPTTWVSSSFKLIRHFAWSIFSPNDSICNILETCMPIAYPVLHLDALPLQKSIILGERTQERTRLDCLLICFWLMAILLEREYSHQPGVNIKRENDSCAAILVSILWSKLTEITNTLERNDRNHLWASF